MNPSNGEQGCFPLICVQKRPSSLRSDEVPLPIVDTLERQQLRHIPEDDQSLLYSIDTPRPVSIDSEETERIERTESTTASKFYGEYFDIDGEENEDESNVSAMFH
jgi:hypothetical protein